MCGLAGILALGQAPAPTRTEVAAMIATLSHRGPDGSTTFAAGPLALAHARLAIVDLAGGWQPLHDESGAISVVCNGEIFNHIELRQALQQRGHVFRTGSDVEVIAHLYEDHGDAFVEHLNGQFAIALWDARAQRLLLVRDAVGMRPLFYTQAGGRLLFASEVKALFAMPEVPRQWRAQALAEVFSFWAALPPGTVFEGVHALPPGHRLVVDAQGMRSQAWWQWSFPPAGAERQAPAAALAEELHALLLSAVKLQLRADVPVGAYLSGGLDSAIVAALISRHQLAPLRTFSLNFDDAEFDEGVYQRRLVADMGGEHSSLRCTSADIAAAFARAVWHAETPLVRTAPVPLMLLAGHVRAAGYKVALTGEGADEVFGGYDLFKEAQVRRFMARAPQSKWRGRLLERLYPYLKHSPMRGRGLASAFFAQGGVAPNDALFAHQPRMAATQRSLQFLHPDVLASLRTHRPEEALEALLPPGFAQYSPLARDQTVESITLMSGYLLNSQGDRVAMAQGIETRMPFLDPRVIAFASQLPPRLKLRGLAEKALLKQAVQGLLPDSIRTRTKQPYRAPESACFFEHGQARDWVAELFSQSHVARSGLFDTAAVSRLFDKCRTGRAIGFADNMAFVGVLSTLLLNDQFIQPR